MKVSIVIAILESYEVVRRQMLWFKKMNLPDDVEIIFVDDGSDPPIDFNCCELKNFRHYRKNTEGMWTQPAARNFGATQAKGKYLLLTDIDHIVPRELIEVGRNPEYDVVRFKREAGVIDENGDFTQDMAVLRSYGLLPERKLRLPPHGNSYLINRKLYLDLGGVSEQYVGTGKYPNREEVPLKQKLKRLLEQGKISICDDDKRPTIYMIPNGKYCGDKDYNPFGLFHNLTRSIRASRIRQREWQNSQS